VVTASPEQLSLHPAWSGQLTVTLTDASGAVLTGRTVTYASSNENVATVGSNGLVTGRGAGTTSITVLSEGKVDVVPVTVTEAPLHSIVILPGERFIPDGLQLQLTVALADERGNSLTRNVGWSTSSEAVATVTATGRVSGVTPGSATITATSEGKSVSVDISVRSRVATIIVSPASATIRVGDEAQLTVTLLDREGNVLSDRDVAFVPSGGHVAVSSTGRLRGLTEGTATIAVRSEGRETLASVSVVEPVMFVDVSPRVATMSVGTVMQLLTTVRDRTGRIVTDRPVTFTTSNPLVATVSTTGLLTALESGVATITVESEGIRSMSQITVP
jgi:uncharacterized protein YjdB